jgi:hypothetical protein
MNELVDFDTAKMLARKGFPQYTIEYGGISNMSKDENNNLIYGQTYSQPNISQLCMWLYEEHKIWIAVDMDGDDTFTCVIRGKSKLIILDNEDKPTQCYKKAIYYVLNELI